MSQKEMRLLGTPINIILIARIIYGVIEVIKIFFNFCWVKSIILLYILL